MQDQTQLQERLDEVEIRYAFLEQLLQDLNDVVTQQATHIDRLSVKLEQMQGQLALASAQASDPNEVPAHY